LPGSLPIPVMGQIGLKWATPAFGCLPFAVPLSGFDQQRVEFIIKPFIGRQMKMEELLRGRIAVLRRNKVVPGQDTARIGIGHKKRQLAGIEQNGVRGFGSQPAEVQQLGPGTVRRLAKQGIQRTLVGSVEPFNERVDGARLLVEISRRPDTRFELRKRCLA